MTRQELVDSINNTIVGIEELFVAEECEDQYVFGCISCQALRVIQDLKDICEIANDTAD